MEKGVWRHTHKHTTDNKHEEPIPFQQQHSVQKASGVLRTVLPTAPRTAPNPTATAGDEALLKACRNIAVNLIGRPR